MRSYRISKYDPRFRAAGGAYQREEWTSFSDIGRSFAGVVVTTDDYLTVEDHYLDAIEAATRCAGVQSVTIAALEVQASARPRLAEYWEYLFDGARLDVPTARVISRLVLREILWCKLVGPDGFYVHFGRDYYMYIGGEFTTDPRDVIADLHVEEFASPYHDAGED